MEHIWQLKWPRCWIWSHLPSCSHWAHIRPPQLLAVKLPSSCAKHTSQNFDQSGANALNLWGLLTARIIKTKGVKSRQWGKPHTLPSFLFYPSLFYTISFPQLIKIQGELKGESMSNVPHPSLRYWPAGDSPSSTPCAVGGGSCTSAPSHSHSKGREGGNRQFLYFITYSLSFLQTFIKAVEILPKFRSDYLIS